MTDQPISRAAQIDDLTEEIRRARYVSTKVGHEDFTPFPALIARADDLEDMGLRFRARFEAAAAAFWSAKTADLLTLVVWLRTAFEEHGPQLGLTHDEILEMHAFEATALERVIGLPQMSLSHVKQMVDQWESRVRGTQWDFPGSAVMVRAELARHEGDPTTVKAVLDAGVNAKLTEGLCADGYRIELARHYALLGCHDEAIALCEPDVPDNGDRCDLHPAETYAGLIVSWAAKQRRDDVVDAARSIRDMYRTMAPTWVEAATLQALLMVDELDAAVDYACELLPRIDQAQTTDAELDLYATVSAVFASRAAHDPDAIIRRRLVGALADELGDKAREIAAQFDRRNRNTVISRGVDDLLRLRTRTVASPDRNQVPIEERSAAELLTGYRAFARVSPRRADRCAEVLATRYSELAGDDLDDAKYIVADALRVADLSSAMTLFDDLAQSDSPAAGRARIAARVIRVQLGELDADVLTEVEEPGVDWAPVDRARHYATSAWAVSMVDRDRAVAVIRRAIAEVESASGYDADSTMAFLNLHLAELHQRQEYDPAIALGTALSRARRVDSAASTPDRRMTATGLLVTSLLESAEQVAAADPGAALGLLDEAVDRGLYELRGGAFRARGRVRTQVGDYDGACDDFERAAAVWTVEGSDHAADAVTVEEFEVRFVRGDDGTSVAERMREVAERMSGRGDVEHEQRALVAAGRGLLRAGLAEDAHRTFRAVLAAVSGEESEGWLGWVHDLDGDALARCVLDEHGVADLLAAYDRAVDHFLAAGDPLAAGDTLRKAGASAMFEGLPSGDVTSRIDRAAALYDGVEPTPTVAFERARLELLRGDHLRRIDVNAGHAVLAQLAQDARTQGWIHIAQDAMQMHAESLLDDSEYGEDAWMTATAMVEEAYLLDTDHASLAELRGNLLSMEHDDRAGDDDRRDEDER